jgi:hypothetical protein
MGEGKSLPAVASRPIGTPFRTPNKSDMVQLVIGIKLYVILQNFEIILTQEFKFQTHFITIRMEKN